MKRYVMTLRCPDQPGIIRAFAEGVVNASGNIVDNQQFSDPDRSTRP
jgi:formyltetrahydrofolate deformylase